MVEFRDCDAESDDIEKLIRVCLPTLKPRYKRIDQLDLDNIPKLKEEQCSDGVDDTFVCLICTEVIRAPVMCTQCQRLFCADCMQSWSERSGGPSQCHCPNC